MEMTDCNIDDGDFGVIGLCGGARWPLLLCVGVLFPLFAW
jgi:hypothetical protein